MDFEIKSLSIKDITPDEEQPRKDYLGIDEFSKSLKTNLIEYPLLVEKTDNGYLIIDGHRRYKAGKLAGISNLWCKVYHKLTPLKRLELRVNLEQHKKDWKVNERDNAWVELYKLIKKEKNDFTRADLANKFGVSWDTINDAFDRIELGLDKSIWEKLPPSFIHEVLGLIKEDKIKLIKIALKEGWNRDRLRQEVREFKMNIKDYKDLDNLSNSLVGLEEVNIIISIPKKYRPQISKWLANGEKETRGGFGKGVMKRCELL